MAKAGIPKQRPSRRRNSFHLATVERKAAEARVRQEKSAALTPQQRIAKLDAGNRYSGFEPFVANKERALLQTLTASVIEAQPEAKKIVARKGRA